MSGYDEDVVRAVAAALLGEEAATTYGYYGTTSLVEAEHCDALARTALDAAYPLIRAQVAREVAVAVQTNGGLT